MNYSTLLFIVVPARHIRQISQQFHKGDLFMLNNISFADDSAFWLEMRKKTCDRNTSFQKRVIAGTHEKTHQSEDGSSAFLWINMEPGTFPLDWHSTVEIIVGSIDS